MKNQPQTYLSIESRDFGLVKMAEVMLVAIFEFWGHNFATKFGHQHRFGL